MRRRSVCALILALGLAPAGSASPTEPAGYLGSFVWRSDDPKLGGLSGIEISADGQDFTVISDRGNWTQGRFLREGSGRITAIEAEPLRPLRGKGGMPLIGGRGDSEGLALAPDGSAYVSFEGTAKVLRYTSLDGPAEPLPIPAAFASMQGNSALEALAIGPDGSLYTLPERSGAPRRPFPVWRFRNGAWDQPFAIPRSGGFLAVGADFGPDGRFYLLERRFHGLTGFSSRVRRFALNPGTDGLLKGETVLESRVGQHDNLEGIAVWRDAGGLRLTLIADDNFFPLQRTEIVEYRISD
ncbi:MAG: esterase-like activity of phytase family protein [Gemmobacter sp.]|jgi:hypothetical protein|nr:esterase-like activity of phytase family protein [Gemmobacter sp.]